MMPLNSPDNIICTIAGGLHIRHIFAKKGKLKNAISNFFKIDVCSNESVITNNINR
jgi:hypothetical protein